MPLLKMEPSAQPAARRPLAIDIDATARLQTAPARPLIEADLLFNQPWFITKGALADMVIGWQQASVSFIVDEGPSKAKLLADRLRASGIKLQNYNDDQDEDDEEREYPVTEDGVACIPITGPLTKGQYWSTTAYSDIQRMCSDAMADSGIKALLLCFDSPGGTASGMFQLSDYLHSARGNKPTCAIADDRCYSAAYCLASATDKLFVTRTGGTGSVGCWVAHASYAGMLAKAGIEISYIFSGDRKVDGNPTQALNDTARNSMQEDCDRIRDMFVQAVARNRAVSADAVYDTEAACYTAETGIPLLADAVGDPADALNYLRGRIASSPGTEEPQPDDNMTANLTSSAGPGYTIFVPGLSPISSISSISINGVPIPGDSFSFGPLSNTIHAGAIAPHKTATSTKSWDGPANEARLKADQTAAYYKKAYAWQEAGTDGTKKANFRFVHHEVSSSGDVGAANVQACRTGIGVLNGARGGTTIPSADRKGVHAHLSAHLKDAGIDAPPLKSDTEYAEALAFANSVDQRVTAVLADMEPMRKQLEFEFGAGVVSRVCRADWNTRAAAADGSRKVTMLVAPYDGSLSSNLGGFRERFEPGAFAGGLSNDPRCLFDHDEQRVLGRASANTARFWEDAAGLHSEADAPDTGWADDLLVSMRRKDITQASPAFWIIKRRQEQRGDQRIQVIEKAILREASVHSFPAYESTTAEAAVAASAAVVEPEPAVIPAAHEREHEMVATRLRLLRLR